MEMQQIIKMLARMEADNKAWREKTKAETEAIRAETKAIQARTKAMREERMKANGEAIQERMVAKMNMVQLVIRSG
jgi:hypothetical protein